jgi:hypothetical protein
MSSDSLSLAEARRIALAAQGFDRARPRRPDAADVARVIRQLGLVQLDFVNVVIPSHYTVLFSRLGPYPRTLLDDAVHRRREFTEAWAHEASIVPMETWPLLGYRRETHRLRPYGFEKVLKKHPEYLDLVLDEVRRRGALTADVLEHPEGSNGRLPEAWGAWFGSIPRATLEAHFGCGRMAVAERRGNMARVYDLAERVIPAAHLGRRVARHDAQRALLAQAARACGVAAAADLADYWRMKAGEARPRLAELVDAGELRQVRVEGWREPAFLHKDARDPGLIEAAALLSPFDPVIWFRKRALRLFGFEHAFEIFTPPAKRRWGVYVLPFLMGDRLVARVDLKADRPAGRLRVQATYYEKHTKRGEVKKALQAELKLLAEWLGLETW